MPLLSQVSLHHHPVVLVFFSAATHVRQIAVILLHCFSTSSSCGIGVFFFCCYACEANRYYRSSLLSLPLVQLEGAGAGPEPSHSLLPPTHFSGGGHVHRGRHLAHRGAGIADRALHRAPAESTTWGHHLERYHGRSNSQMGMLLNSLQDNAKLLQQPHLEPLPTNTGAASGPHYSRPSATRRLQCFRTRWAASCRCSPTAR